MLNNLIKQACRKFDNVSHLVKRRDGYRGMSLLQVLVLFISIASINADFCDTDDDCGFLQKCAKYDHECVAYVKFNFMKPLSTKENSSDAGPWWVVFLIFLIIAPCVLCGLCIW